MSFGGLSMGVVLGRGTFGEVREFVDRTGCKLAVKCIEKAKLNRKRRERVQMEVDILTSLADHDGICRLSHAAQDDRFVYFFLEHMNGGDLFDYMQQRGGPLDERREVLLLFRQLCEAVAHCHAKGVVCHDLKLENFCLSFPSPADECIADAGDDEDEEEEEEDNSTHTNDDSRGEETDDEDDNEDHHNKSTTTKRRQKRRAHQSTEPRHNIDPRQRLPEGTRVKLIDFGLACRVKHAGQLLATFSGTEQYAAPEMLEGRAYDGFKTDAYALGVVLYVLLTSSYPFHPDDIDAQFEEQTSPAFLASLPFPSHVSSHARDLVWSLLRADPRRRITPDAALRHPFFSSAIDTVSTSSSSSTETKQSVGEEEEEVDDRAVGSSSSGVAEAEVEEVQEGEEHARTGFWQEELQVAAVLANFDSDSDDMSLGY